MTVAGAFVQTQQWSIEQSKQLYAIQQWGNGYFRSITVAMFALNRKLIAPPKLICLMLHKP
jgi:arginine decarboxylase-like protein